MSVTAIQPEEIIPSAPSASGRWRIWRRCFVNFAPAWATQRRCFGPHFHERLQQSLRLHNPWRSSALKLPRHRSSVAKSVECHSWPRVRQFSVF